MAMNEYFGTPLTGTRKQQLWAESVTWRERYGLSMQPVFGTYEEFQSYWAHMLAEESKANETTDFALRAAADDLAPDSPAAALRTARLPQDPRRRKGLSR